MDAKRLAKYQQRLHRKPPLIGRWLWHKAIEALAADSSPEAVQVLAEAVALNGDESEQRILVEALRQLAEQRNVDAQEALCSLVITHDHAFSREAALKTQ